MTVFDTPAQGFDGQGFVGAVACNTDDAEDSQMVAALNEASENDTVVEIEGKLYRARFAFVSDILGTVIYNLLPAKESG